jgi:hypothetical protein
MREDSERKFLTLKHAIEELNLDVKEQLKVGGSLRSVDR